jgi:hypothetical protein
VQDEDVVMTGDDWREIVAHFASKEPSNLMLSSRAQDHIKVDYLRFCETVLESSNTATRAKHSSLSPTNPQKRYSSRLKCQMINFSSTETLSCDVK